jgi:hypothetical protein
MKVSSEKGNIGVGQSYIEGEMIMPRAKVEGLVSFKGRSFNEGDKVRVYRNLHNGGFSIKKGGLVIAHADEVHLVGVTTLINEKDRQKVLQTKTKGVHAYVIGRLSLTTFNEENAKTMYYNPYKTKTFVDTETMKEVNQANEALCKGKAVLYR